MAKPFLPIAPEDIEAHVVAQEFRVLKLFEQVLDKAKPKLRKRRNSFNDYTNANCEEAWGGRPSP